MEQGNLPNDQTTGIAAQLKAMVLTYGGGATYNRGVSYLQYTSKKWITMESGYPQFLIFHQKLGWELGSWIETIICLLFGYIWSGGVSHSGYGRSLTPTSSFPASIYHTVSIIEHCHENVAVNKKTMEGWILYVTLCSPRGSSICQNCFNLNVMKDKMTKDGSWYCMWRRANCTGPQFVGILTHKQPRILKTIVKTKLEITNLNCE